MYLYRIALCRHINDLSGVGGLYASGRWHNRGSRILYFSEHISLAKLEVLANTGFLPKNMCLLTAHLSDNISISEINKNDLPDKWDTYPYIEDLKTITNEWLKLAKSVVLKVPSSQSENEHNFLINPIHKDMEKLEVKKTEPVQFDHRLKLK